MLAEGDTQGSFVGIDVRKHMYAKLVDALGRDAFAARTISGDVSSNGTVAEIEYIADEAEVSGEIPTVAVGGDHDSETTWKQMSDAGIDVVDLDTIEVDDLRFSGANDREHKTLVRWAGHQRLRDHRGGARRTAAREGRRRAAHRAAPSARRGCGLPRISTDLNDVARLDGSQTVPYDDGIPDQVPGTINIGHRHVLDGPWVLWNTDGDEITWTVVDQLGTAGGVREHPDVQPLQHSGLGAIEAADRAAAVLRRRVGAADRLRLDHLPDRRHLRGLRPRRRRHPRRRAGPDLVRQLEQDQYQVELALTMTALRTD